MFNALLGFFVFLQRLRQQGDSRVTILCNPQPSTEPIHFCADHSFGPSCSYSEQGIINYHELVEDSNSLLLQRPDLVCRVLLGSEGLPGEQSHQNGHGCATCHHKRPLSFGRDVIGGKTIAEERVSLLLRAASVPTPSSSKKSTAAKPRRQSS